MRGELRWVSYRICISSAETDSNADMHCIILFRRSETGWRLDTGHLRLRKWTFERCDRWRPTLSHHHSLPEGRHAKTYLSSTEIRVAFTYI
jgi:hypothetical protein